MNKADQSKQKLTQATLELLAEKSFSQLTIQDIVERAGLSRMAFYRNYSNKLEIVQAHLDEVTNNFIQSQHVDYKPGSFQDYLVTLFTHLKAQEELGRLLYRSNLLYLVKDEFDKIFASKAKSHQEEYNFRFIAGGLYNIYAYWLSHGCQESPNKIAEMFSDFFML